jgi:hypothetical protein
MREHLSIMLTATLLAAGPAFAQNAAAVPITVTAKGCEPTELTVKAGSVTFLITNRSNRALEWEILKGVMIVDERENIAPGFKQRLITRLEPGEYAVTCGLLSNPRGKLTVLNAGGGTAAGTAKPGVAELIGVAAEYRVWLVAELDRLSKAASAGERAAARDTFMHLASVNPLVKPQAESLEVALRVEGGDLSAPAKAYVVALRQLSLSPQALMEGLAATAQALGTAAGADASILFAGIEAPAAHILPMAKRADPALGEHLEKAMADMRSAFGGQGTLDDAAAALAAELSRLPAALGLS